MMIPLSQSSNFHRGNSNTTLDADDAFGCNSTLAPNRIAVHARENATA